MSECPRCHSAVTWRNAAVRCLDCGLDYCKECPDYRWGRFQVRCPECGCREARPLNGSDEAPDHRSAESPKPPPRAMPPRRRDREASDSSRFAFE